MTVTPVADPTVGNLATPINSSSFSKAFLNALPAYRPSLSPNRRGLEVGMAHGFFLYGPFALTGPLRLTEYASTAGLLATLMDLSSEEVQQDRSRFGNVLETFVFGELLKHTTTAEGNYHLMYYRDADKVEVDVVIENAAGQLVGVEVKAAATVKDSDLRGLRKLARIAGDQFKLGVLLYDGTETMPLGDGIWAAPLSSLWGA